MNEGVEIDPDVADGPRSLILEQVAEGIPVRMAALWRTLRGDSAGARRAGRARRSLAPGQPQAL